MSKHARSPTAASASDFFKQLHMRLQEARIDHDLVQGRIADNLAAQGFDIKQATVSAYERNPRRLTQHSPQYASAFLQEYKISREEADRITAEMFLHTFGGVLSFVLDNSDELEEPSLPQAGMRYIPVYSHVGAGPGGEDGVVLRHMEIDADMPGDVAYEVNGHSMEPDIPHGSVVIVKRGSFELGDIVVAWVPDEGMVVKRLIVSKPEDRAVLASSNPDYARLIAEGATIFGRVTEARKRY